MDSCSREVWRRRGCRRPSVRRIWGGGLILAFAISLVACDPGSSNGSMGAAPSDAPSGVSITWIACVPINSVELQEKVSSGEGKRLWRIESVDGQPTTGTFIVGETPSGFRETVALDLQALQGDPLLLAVGEGTSAGNRSTLVFRPSDLTERQETVNASGTYDVRRVPVNDFQSQATRC